MESLRSSIEHTQPQATRIHHALFETLRKFRYAVPLVAAGIIAVPPRKNEDEYYCCVEKERPYIPSVAPPPPASEKVHISPPPTHDEIQALIGEINSNTFMTRKKAVERLQSLIERHLESDRTEKPFMYDTLLKGNENSTAEQRSEMRKIRYHLDDDLAWRYTAFHAPEEWKTKPPAAFAVMEELQRQSGHSINAEYLSDCDVVINHDFGEECSFWDVVDVVLDRTKHSMRQWRDGSLRIAPLKDIRKQPPMFDPETLPPQATHQYFASQGSVHGILHIDENMNYRNYKRDMPVVRITLQCDKVYLNGWSIKALSGMSSGGRGLRLRPEYLENASYCYINLDCPPGDGKETADISITFELGGYSLSTGKRLEPKERTLMFNNVVLPLEREERQDQ